ncbi:MAG: hypothetical protein M3Z24_16300 [Chloroflexota bacterium]|nr:hypothetical protein [Chloroflexota bacterium]
MSLDIMTNARDELAETMVTSREDLYQSASFPHARLSPERFQDYKERIRQLVKDLINEPYDPNGEVYGFSIAMFLAPPYLQISNDDDKA